MSSQDRWVDYAIVGGASVFLLLGVALLAFGLRNVWRAHCSERWPKATATVIRSQTTVASMPDSNVRSSSTVYLADIAFRYQVNGRDYTTTIRHFGQLPGSGDSSEAQLAELRYPANAKVRVSYDPANPAMAAAEPGFHPDALWVPGAGLAFAVPAVMFVVLWFSMSRGDNRGLAIGMGIFCMVFATLGGIFLAKGIPNLWRSYQSTRWPQTRGIVIHGRRDSKQPVPDGDSQFTISSGKHFVYRYQVGGQTYFSNTRRFGQTDDPNMQNSSLYPLGREVAVTYAPDNPAIATIETGVVNETWWIPGAGAAFFLFGVAVFLFGIPALTR